MKTLKTVFGLFLILPIFINAQLLDNGQSFTRADTLRGSLRKERNFDVRKYHLNLLVNPDKKYIEGFSNIEFIPQENLKTIQIDLFENLKVDSIIHRGKKLGFKREFNAVFIDFEIPLSKNKRTDITFYYSGNPIIAKRAPWDGGFVFTQDPEGKPWIATACQGLGASAWWPNKDHQSDEPEEGMSIKVAVPNGLMNVSNGRFKGSTDLGNGYTRWDWEVANPINNYNVALNIADYAHFKDEYKGLSLDYYVLKENLEKAKKQFEEVKPMMDCFYEKFGEYPFKEDGYKLVETPHLGMEHQSAVAYGNKYMKGYLGRDVSGSGVGLKTDFIIIHESGHEWFGNSITSEDIADMWIHEGFTTYADAVYLECRFGYEESQKYITGIRNSVANNAPIIGKYGLNNEGSPDMYYKAANMLNNIRHMVNNDTKWWAMLKKYAETYKHSIVTTDIVVAFFEKESGLFLKPVFDQYLKHKDLPILELKQKGKDVLYRWKADVEGFSMPFDVMIDNSERRLKPKTTWQQLNKVLINNVKPIESRFYIKEERL